MKSRALALLALFLVPLDTLALVNGKLAPPGMFPSVGAMSGCTATKVGPRHYLLAAHCYMAKIGSPRNLIKFDFGNTSRILESHQVTLHPSWIETCSKIECTGNEVGTPQDNPRKVDAALVRLAWDEPSVPHSPIHRLKLNPGDAVTMAGRGCTQGIGEPGSGLRYNASVIVSHTALIHSGSLYAPVAELAKDSNAVTPGYATDKSYPSLCPGDSGGPLFVRQNDEWRLAGIHADYTFYGDYEAGGLSVTNLHTRLDDESYYRVGEWARRLLAR